MVLLVADGLQEGGHELAISVLQWQDKQGQSMRRWFPLDVAKSEDVLKQVPVRVPRQWDVEGGLNLSKAVVDEDENGWYLLSLNIHTPNHDKRCLVQCGQGRETAWSGQLTAIDRKGGPVPLSVYRLSDYAGLPGPWRMVGVRQQGATVKVKFRIKEPAANGRVSRLKVDLLTDRGVQTVWVNDFAKLVKPATRNSP